MQQSRVVSVERLDFRFEPRRWDYADTNRAAMDTHFATRQRANPALWNGRVLVAHRHEVADGVCCGAFLETDFASFMAWRDWGWPEAATLDCFGAATLQASDGAYLLGVMGPQTANAGRIYFPCGTPDPGDIVDGRVDLERSALRELREETGLEAGSLHVEPGCLVVFCGPLVMHAKLLRADEPAEALRARILRHLATQRQPELSDIRIVRGPDDLDANMPPFIRVFFTHICEAQGIAGAGADPLEQARRVPGLTDR
jgi:8-oxo-dGTP pyrophosphatase MutT (NUDIX family)